MNDRQHLELINGTCLGQRFLLFELVPFQCVRGCFLTTTFLNCKLPFFYSFSTCKGYFQYAGGFEPRNAYDITATLPDNGYRDPMFIIEAVKEKKNKA